VSDTKSTPLTMVGQPDAATCVGDACEWPPPSPVEQRAARAYRNQPPSVE
jgi:hypothetical protein